MLYFIFCKLNIIYFPCEGHHQLCLSALPISFFKFSLTASLIQQETRESERLVENRRNREEIEAEMKGEEQSKVKAMEETQTESKSGVPVPVPIKDDDREVDFVKLAMETMGTTNDSSPPLLSPNTSIRSQSLPLPSAHLNFSFICSDPKPQIDCSFSYLPVLIILLRLTNNS